MVYKFKGQELLRLNENSLLSIERRRNNIKVFDTDSTSFCKDPSELFEEKYLNDMVMPIPSGPQALSLDVSYPKGISLYGIPERINTFNLKNTVGTELKVEPYRLFTLDHFSDYFP